jgi:hypothetical protein
MGVTIHYAGQLHDPANHQSLLDFSQDYAMRSCWSFSKLPFAVGNLQGFVVRPHQDCEPVEFIFGNRNRFSSWVKTQFSGPDTHIQIVRFLREIKPFLGRLGVSDEGEYWQTESRETLEWHMNKVNEVIASYVDANPQIQTKVRTPDGRIIDLIE